MATYAGPTQVDIQPDEDMMSAHLENWFGACMEGEIDIGWIDPKTGVLNKFKRFDVGDFDLAAAFAAEINVTPGASVYYRPAVIPKSAPVFVRDEHAQFVPGVWADLDNEGAAEAVKNVCPPDCKPTTAVITGRKPYKRVQLYWKFPEPMDAGNLVKLHNGGIADKLDGDPAVINPGTLMRLGGSIAWPRPSKSKPGRVPELTEFKVLKGRPPTVTPMQVQHAFPFKQETPPTAPPSATLDKPLIQITKADLNPDLRKLVENGLPEGERSEGFHHAVGWLKDGGWDAGQIAEYMAEHPAGIGEKYLSPKDRLLKEVQRSFNKCVTEQKEKAEKPRGLRLLTLDELLNRPPPEFLIEDIIPKQGVGILAGQTGSMKTFLAIQLALSVALGLNIGTKTTEKAGSLFLLNEGQAGFGIRCAAWLKHHRVEAPKIFYATDQTPNLMHDTSLDPYKEIVAAAKFNPGFIVIDTFNKASVGGDDNSTSDMALAIETAYKLADHFNAFVLLIDHVGKDARRGIRGAYSKIANVDMAGMVTKAGKQVALKTTKQKEGEDNLTFDFSVNIVEVVHPQTGEILNVPALAAIRSSLQMPQKDFIVSRIDLAGPISREQMAKEFTDRYGAKKSFNTQLGRLVEMGKIKEADGVLTAP